MNPFRAQFEKSFHEAQKRALAETGSPTCLAARFTVCDSEYFVVPYDLASEMERERNELRRQYEALKARVA